MRILFCAHEAPLEPFDGFRGPVGSLIGRLRESNEVRVLALRMPDQSADAPPWMRLVDHPHNGPVDNARLFARAIARRRPLRVDALAALLSGPLHDELEGFRPDVVHVTSGRLAALGPYLDEYPRVLAAMDAMHLNMEARNDRASRLRRLIVGGEAARWRRFEADAWARFPAITVVSAQDGDALRALSPSMPIHVILNGIDADRFASAPSAARQPNRILFHGIMNYAPNVSAALFLARTVLPRIRVRRPEAHLVIVGRSPAPEVVALGELDNVTVTGPVPDVVQSLSAAAVYVCPMRTGTGVKNKLLEAMANELPCVATPLAARGLAVSDGRHLLVGETEEELAQHTVRILEDPTLGRALGAAARSYVLEEHDWRGVARAYETLYRRICERHLSPSSEGS